MFSTLTHTNKPVFVAAITAQAQDWQTKIDDKTGDSAKYFKWGRELARFCTKHDILSWLDDIPIINVVSKPVVRLLRTETLIARVGDLNTYFMNVPDELPPVPTSREDSEFARSNLSSVMMAAAKYWTNERSLPSRWGEFYRYWDSWGSWAQANSVNFAEVVPAFFTQELRAAVRKSNDAMRQSRKRTSRPDGPSKMRHLIHSCLSASALLSSELLKICSRLRYSLCSNSRPPCFDSSSQANWLSSA